MRTLGFAALALALLVPGAAMFRGESVYAQHGPVQRIVDGNVQDSAGAPVEGAVVYLKDTKSLAVKSYVSNDSGYFHFTQISPDADYSIWAVSAGKSSKIKGISSFDSKKTFHFILKIEEDKQ